METKELKIEVPQGYEIDRQKSTFEKIVFKKIPENPKTWEDYCSLMKGKTIYYTNFTWSEGVIVTHNCDINDCALTFPTQEIADKIYYLFYGLH